MSEIYSVGQSAAVFGRQAGPAAADVIGFTRSQGSDSVREENSSGEVVSARVDEKNIRAQTERLSQALQQFHRHLKFEILEDSHEVVVKVIDSDTGDTIREIPPEHMQRVAEWIEEMGIVLDERA
jgi:flagellar protein FlaG